VRLFASRIRPLPGITAAASLLLLGLGVYQVVDLYRQANALYDQIDRAMASVSADIPDAQRIDFLDVVHFDPAPGLWMIVAAGLLGTVVSSLMLLRAKPKGVGAAPVDVIGGGEPVTDDLAAADVYPGFPSQLILDGA
jgi:hypothetical protein